MASLLGAIGKDPARVPGASVRGRSARPGAAGLGCAQQRGTRCPGQTRDIPAHQYRTEAAVSQRGGILYLK